MIAALLVAMAGCVYKPVVVEQHGAVSRQELFSRLAERARYWSTYQASVHLKAQSAKGKFRLRAVIVAQLPDRLRLEAFTPLGQTAGVFVSDPSLGARLWIPSEKVVYSSPRPEALIQHFLGVPITVKTFAYSLSASVPPGLELSGSPLSPPADPGWIISALESPGEVDFTWTLLAQPVAMKTVGIRRGPLSYTVDYEPPTKLEPQQTPGEIRFNSSQWQMEVRIDQMKPNPEIREDAFELTAPAGVQQVRLHEDQ